MHARNRRDDPREQRFGRAAACAALAVTTALADPCTRDRAGIRRRRRPTRPPSAASAAAAQRPPAATLPGPSKRCATQPSAASECSPRKTTRMRWSHASRSRQNSAPCAVSPAIAAGSLLPAMVEIVVPEPRHVAGHRVHGETASRGAPRERDAGREARVVENLVERHASAAAGVGGERRLALPRATPKRPSRPSGTLCGSSSAPRRATARRLRIIRRAAARNRPPTRARHGTRALLHWPRHDARARSCP